MTDTPFRAPPLAERAVTLRRWARRRRWAMLEGEKVAELLVDDWTGAGPLRLNESLQSEDVNGVRMVANARAILAAAAGQGKIRTARKPLGLVVTTVPGFSTDVRTGFHDRGGPIIEPLHWTEGLLEAAGLLAWEGRRLVPTASARSLAGPDQAGRLFAHLFRAFFQGLDLAYTDPFPPMPLVQDLVPYWLWVLAQPSHAPALLSADHFLWNFTPEPRRRDREAEPARLRQLIQKRVFDPLADFGLVEFAPHEGDARPPEIGDERFQATPLYARFLQWAPSFLTPAARPALRLMP